jgi:methyltransferase
MVPWFAALLLATGAMRLVELAVSVRRQRARPDAVVAEGGLFAAMAALHAALVVLPLAEVWLRAPPFDPRLGAAAGALLVVATALRVWTLRTIGGSWNVRIVRPEATGIATTGPYRWVRHPNYLCVAMELLALPLLHGAWLSAAVLGLWNAAVLAVRIRNEEAVLATIPAWRAAFADRARLLPGVW